MAPPTGSFRPADRLLRSAQFEHVLRHGRRTVIGEFVVMTASRPRPESRQRLGITVSKRVGNSVVRNHVKRRVREWFRANRQLLPPSTDLVVVGRSGAGRLSGAEIAARLRAAIEHSGQVQR